MRRLEACAGIVEPTIGASPTTSSSARDYDACRTKQLGARVLSLIELDAQMTTNATWLDRSLISHEPGSAAR